VRRNGDELSLESPTGAQVQAAIDAGPPVAAARDEVIAAFHKAEAEFEGVRALVPYRIKTTWVTAGLVGAHVLGLLILPLILGSMGRASIMVLGGWLAYFLWLKFYYFP
jgi:hypothetical protein